MVIVAVFVESCGMALFIPHLEGFVYAAIDPADRARILAVSNTVVLAIASPFGWIAGALSEANQVLPFVLIGVLVLSVATFLVVVRPGHERPASPQ